MQLHVMCNLSYVTTQICSCMCRMQLNFSCKRQLQNPKFLIVYVPSCTDSIVKKMKSLIRNLVWSSQADGKARAKVAWDTAILPLAKVGINILDPEAQITTLLTKMLLRGLTPRSKPWKVLLYH